MQLKGCLLGGVCSTRPFNIELTKDCSIFAITVASTPVDHSFIINTPITTTQNRFTVPAFTSTSDQYCNQKIELTLFQGDSNSNNVMDTGEFSTVIPTMGASSNYLFFKSSPYDVYFYVNVLKPLLNTDSENYYLKARYFHDANALTQEAFTTTKITIIADCSIETITPSSLSNMPYTIHAAP